MEVFYLGVMSYKLHQCQEIAWCRELHISPIQPGNVLLPVGGTFRTPEFSCELYIRHLLSLSVMWSPSFNFGHKTDLFANRYVESITNRLHILLGRMQCYGTEKCFCQNIHDCWKEHNITKNKL